VIRLREICFFLHVNIHHTLLPVSETDISHGSQPQQQLAHEERSMSQAGLNLGGEGNIFPP
jgi:hypothetical protein